MIIIGEIRQKLAGIINSVSPKAKIITSDLSTMHEIVKLAKTFTEPGDTVILSPGCGSFDMFKNFEERGNKFKEIISKI